MNLLESLRYLAALEQHRHFGRAAQACHITQPALSNAIRALEQAFGATVVRRGRQYEGLTPEGELVLAHGHRMLHEAEALFQALASLVGAPVHRPGSC
jgi:DNA-binding transcriptional LysR family regulator